MTNPDAKVLGKILTMQSLLHVALDVKWLGEILVKVLLEVPGLESVALYIGQDQVAQDSKPQCQPNWPAFLEFDESSSIIMPCQNILALPLETAKKEYGHLLLAFEDAELFDPYSPHIENTLNIAALIIENKEQEEQLTLLTHTLEERVSKQVRKISIQKDNLRQMFDEASYGIALADPDSGIMIDCNMAFAAMLKGDKAKIIGKYQREFHIADEHAEEMSTSFKQHLGEKSGHTLESRLVTLTGESIDVEIKARVIQLGDKQLLQGFFKDITENKNIERQLQLSKERFQDIAESMGDWIWEVDAEGLYTYVSDSVKEALGYDVDEMIGKSPFDFLPEAEAVRVKSILDQYDAKKESFSDVENISLHKNGSLVYLSSSGKPIISDTGAVLGFRGINRDITSQKQAEEKRLQLEDQLRQSQKIESLGRLAGGVAHDYNNMLSVIIGNVELGKMKVEPSAPVNHNLEHIHQAANRSRDITRQLLTFARKQIINPKVLDLNHSVADMLKMLCSLLGENIDLIWHPKKDICLVKMDSSQLDQILANLCINARDAIDNVGKMTIETDIVSFDDNYCKDHPGFIPGNFVLLAVSDSGCGMDKQTLKNVFEPFFTTKKMGEGTGLGMATVYGIIRQSEGFINVYSEPDKGSTFRIYLPRYEGEGASVKEATASQIQKGQGETVLLVEDEVAIVQLATAMLEDLGYRVLAANSPTEALSVAEVHQGEIQLLLTDVVMPGMNGRDLAKQVQEMYPEIKTIYMSGYTADVIAHHGVLDESINFIQKPFARADLSILISEVLGSNSSAEALYGDLS